MGLSKWEGRCLRIAALSLGLLALLCLRAAVTQQPLVGEWVFPREDAPQSAETAAPLETEGKRVNLNTADLETLMSLPKVGEARAAHIIAYREEYGGFRVPEDLINVESFSDELVEELLDYITTEEVP